MTNQENPYEYPQCDHDGASQEYEQESYQKDQTDDFWNDPDANPLDSRYDHPWASPAEQTEWLALRMMMADIQVRRRPVNGITASESSTARNTPSVGSRPPRRRYGGRRRPY